MYLVFFTFTSRPIEDAASLMLVKLAVRSVTLQEIIAISSAYPRIWTDLVMMLLEVASSAVLVMISRQILNRSQDRA